MQSPWPHSQKYCTTDHGLIVCSGSKALQGLLICSWGWGLLASTLGNGIPLASDWLKNDTWPSSCHEWLGETQWRFWESFLSLKDGHAWGLFWLYTLSAMWHSWSNGSHLGTMKGTRLRGEPVTWDGRAEMWKELESLITSCCWTCRLWKYSPSGLLEGVDKISLRFHHLELTTTKNFLTSIKLFTTCVLTWFCFCFTSIAVVHL